MNRHPLRYLLPLAVLAMPLAAQHGHGKPQTPNPYDLRGLTKDPGPDEPRFMLDYELAYPAVSEVRANPVAPRMIAEWEKVQGALIRYPLGISVDAVKAMATELKVYVLCASSSQSAARTAFQNAGVNLANIAFITATTDTYWTRDYAPWWITTDVAGKREVRLVDVVYRANGVRPNDDRVPQVVASYFQQPAYFSLDFVCQGGNVMTDSKKAGASTDRLRDENPGYTEAQLKTMATTTAGLSPYYVITDPAYPKDYIKHIDCWAKFISPTKVLVKRVPSSDSYYSDYEAAAEQWRTRTNAAGEPYTVIRIDGSAEAPYVNHVILNDRVFVPVLTSETSPADKAALDQIRAAYGSGYRVIGVKAASGLPWLGTDSIHCRVNAIPVFSGLSDQTDTPQSQAPTITSQPQSLTVNAGQMATFQVTASGTAPFTFQWYRNNAVLSGATSATYMTSATTSADSGAQFHVVVTNGVGSATSTKATLTISSTTTNNEQVLNGGFESGATSWSGTTGAIGTWAAQTAYQGAKYAWLGGNGKTATETLYQTVTIPANATTATLSFYLHIDTAETTSTSAYDKLDVSIQNTSGVTLKTLATYSNLNKATGYQSRSFDLGAYKGQTLRVYFKMTEDSSAQTSFVVDNVSLLTR